VWPKGFINSRILYKVKGAKYEFMEPVGPLPEAESSPRKCYLMNCYILPHLVSSSLFMSILRGPTSQPVRTQNQAAKTNYTEAQLHSLGTLHGTRQKNMNKLCSLPLRASNMRPQPVSSPWTAKPEGCNRFINSEQICAKLSNEHAHNVIILTSYI
jgi:hypothetical protein